jgi:hypothetical protein
MIVSGEIFEPTIPFSPNKKQECQQSTAKVGGGVDWSASSAVQTGAKPPPAYAPSPAELQASTMNLCLYLDGHFTLHFRET